MDIVLHGTITLLLTYPLERRAQGELFPRPVWRSRSVWHKGYIVAVWQCCSQTSYHRSIIDGQPHILSLWSTTAFAPWPHFRWTVLSQWQSSAETLTQAYYGNMQGFSVTGISHQPGHIFLGSELQSEAHLPNLPSCPLFFMIWRPCPIFTYLLPQ